MVVPFRGSLPALSNPRFYFRPRLGAASYENHGLSPSGSRRNSRSSTPQTRELRSHVEQIMDGVQDDRERVKTEMHQSVVEVGTDICPDVAGRPYRRHQAPQRPLAARPHRGLTIAASGTHPFSHWMDQKITKGERYEGIVEDMQQVARANLIFGLHVHVGIPDREVAIQVMNMARYFLPHIFALSTNSPFWLGRNTGFKSYRVKVFERFPAHRHPRRLREPRRIQRLPQPARQNQVHR